MQSKLDFISVSGFKSIKLINELRIGPLTVLIGPNGSGKTNFIGIFSFLNAIREGRLQEYVAKAGGADRVLHFGSRVTDKVQIEISFEGGVNAYEIALKPSVSDQLVPLSEYACFWDKPTHAGPIRRPLVATGMEAGISRQNLTRIASYVQRHLAGWRVYHFHDTSDVSPMKKTADVDDNRHLRNDGSNLAPFLHLLREKHEDSYRMIVATVRQMAPFFREFSLEPKLMNQNKIILEWKHEGTDRFFDASSLSDGTLRFIALATLFLQPIELRPSVIVVDEPELGLHPYAITLLASLMKQAATETQVIVSTQSSLLLDHFDPKEVLVADRVGGATKYTQLEPSELESWLEEYGLGQLWEKNFLGGRPGPE